MATIRYNLETLRATDTGSALGQIWFDIGGRSFPSSQWDDFIIFVLDWWRLGIRNVLTGADDDAIFAFMDDPYELWMRPMAGGYSFTCKYHDEEIASGNEDHAGMRDLAQSYYDCVGAVLERIEEDSDWRTTYLGSVPQIEDLKAELPRFERLLAEFENAKSSS